MDRFKSPDSKLGWAHKHLTSLGSDLDAWRKANPYEGVIEDHAKWGHAIRFKTSGAAPCPEEFSHRIGEFATALRASMDHLIWGLMTGTPKNSNKVQFPIFDTKPRYDAEWPKQLSGVVDTAEPIIKDLQPYKAPKPHADPLWRIHRLSNTDKHRIIILAPHAARLSFGPQDATVRQALTLAFTAAVKRGSFDEDEVMPLPPPLYALGVKGYFKVDMLFAILLQNADADTGIFLTIDELPSLYDHVRDKVFPPLKALIP